MSFQRIIDAQNPVVALENIVGELRWRQRLSKMNGVVNPVIEIIAPRKEVIVTTMQIKIRVRYAKADSAGKLVPFGAVMQPPFSDTEVFLLSRPAIKERLEAWFTVMLGRVNEVSPA